MCNAHCYASDAIRPSEMFAEWLQGGLCVSECPTQALALLQKSEEAFYHPPANVFETYVNMAKERGNI